MDKFPLIKIFPYGDDLLLYDAKAHFAFIISPAEKALLDDFLSSPPDAAPMREHPQAATDRTASLLAKFAELRAAGLFIAGPAAEVSPAAPEAVRRQLEYDDENILLRKFCLGVTEDCNFRCTYCKRTVARNYQGHSRIYLSEENAFRAIDYYFQKYTAFFDRLPPEKQRLLLEVSPPSLSWYGGEPFLNFPLIKATAGYFRRLPWPRHGIQTDSLRFTSNTNLSVMNDEILTFLTANRVLLFASLDGPAEEHDRCRVFESGQGTFSVAYRNLMAIKAFDKAYFRECVSIFAVFTDRHDAARCLEFIEGLGALLCQQFPAEYTGTFVADPETALLDDRAAQRRLEAFRQTAATADAAGGDPPMQLFAHLIPFARLNTDLPAGSNALNTRLTCPMGFDNLMVAANGDLLICHKVDGSMPVGHAQTGLDMDRLATLNLRYNSAVNNDECRSCWCVRFCSVCAATRMAGNRFIHPTTAECDVFRQRIAHDFACYIHLSREHPALLEKIFAFARDPKKYIGIIDIHDF